MNSLRQIINSTKRFLGTSLLVGALTVNPFSAKNVQSQDLESKVAAVSDGILWQYTGSPQGLSVESFLFNSAGDIFVTTRYFPPDGYWLEEAKYRIERSIDNGITWTSVMEASWHSVSTVINKEGHIYAAYFSRIYRSTDNGNSWEIINEELPVSFIHKLSISPEGYIYLGANGGNYRSTDNGYNWTKLDLEFQAKDYVFKTDGHIFASVVSGHYPNPPCCLYRSKDNGKTWEQVLYAEKTYYWYIAINKMGYIFAATSGINGTYNGVYRSTDNGDTWTEINADLPSLNVGSIIVDSDDNVLVGINGSGVYRSTDKGENWVVYNNGLSDLRIVCLGINYKSDIFVGTGGNNYPPNKSGHVFISTFETSVEKNQLPTAYSLLQNYPNPFNLSTTIKYNLPENTKVSLDIYNISGQKVKTLVDKIQEPGQYNINFNAGDLSSGIYFPRLKTPYGVKTNKMMLVK